MLRPVRLLLLAVALTATVAAAPAGTTHDTADAGAPVGASLDEGTFPLGVCAWARDVSDRKFCVIVNDPRPWLP